MMYITVPEINPEAIRIDLGTPMNSEEIRDAMDNISAILPDEDAARDLYTRYMILIAEQITNVSEAKEAVTIGSVSQKSTKLTATIDGSTIKNIALAVLGEAKNDKVIIDFVDKISELSDTDIDYNSAIDDAMDSVVHSPAPDVSFDINFWVNSKGKIIGLGLTVEQVSVYIQTVEANNNTGVRFAAENLLFEGNGINKSKKHTGSYTLSYNNMKILNVSLEDVDTKKLEDSIFDGKISIKVDSGIKSMLRMVLSSDVADLISGAEIAIVSSQDDKNGPSKASISYLVDDKLWASVSGESTIKDGGSVVIPSSYVDSSYSDEMTEWVMNADLYTVFGNIKKSGLPTEYATQIEALLGMLDAFRSQPEDSLSYYAF